MTFEAGCARSFVLSQTLAPDSVQGWMDQSTNPTLTACVKQVLERTSFDCASDYPCGFGYVEAIPLMCEAP